jgi:hypothetical protein
MSNQEQHQIIGKTALEHKEAIRSLAALEAKANSWADSMRIVSQRLCPVGVMYTGSGGGLSGRTLEAALEDYPDRSQVVALLEEIRVCTAKIQQLSKLLTDMGL